MSNSAHEYLGRGHGRAQRLKSKLGPTIPLATLERLLRESTTPAREDDDADDDADVQS
jgi:hypothetical protein